jgi:hypothetical protein
MFYSSLKNKVPENKYMIGGLEILILILFWLRNPEEKGELASFQNYCLSFFIIFLAIYLVVSL